MTNVNFDQNTLLVASTFLTTAVAAQANAGSQPGSDTRDLIFPITIGVLSISGCVCAAVRLFKIWSSRQSDVSVSFVNSQPDVSASLVIPPPPPPPPPPPLLLPQP